MHTDTPEIHTIYDITATVAYRNDREYRQCIRDVFYMKVNTQKIHTWKEMDMDDVSIDELMYDESITFAIDFIYSNTAHLPLFRKLYRNAAAKMISNNLEIGLVILFSYDYFFYFHPCLVDFFHSPESYSASSSSYMELSAKL